MKLFFRHKDDTNPRQQEREHSITLTERNYFLLDDNDVPLKFRMTEELERMVDEICSYLDTSASDFIRQVLFIHLYGRYDLLGLLERQFPVLDERRRMVIPSGPPDDAPPKRSANIADFKVWLPRVMKDDLAFLAQAEGVTLSRYVRNVIITHLTGHAGLADHSPINRSLHAPSTVRIRKNRGTLDQ
jgi:hypothetical protein